MIKLSAGQNDKQTFKGTNVKGLKILIEAQHTTANTAFTTNPVDWSKIVVKMTLTRAGQKFIIFSDVALPLLAESGFYNGAYGFAMQIAPATLAVKVAAASGVDEVIHVTGCIDLHEIINVKNDDKLDVEIQFPTGSLASTVDTSASTLYYDVVEGIGNGISIPTIHCEAIRGAQSSVQESFGDAVVSACFINTDKAGITDANAVISTLDFQSDKLRFSEDYNELLAKRQAQFVDDADANNRNQSFKFLDVKNLNYSGKDVRLNRAQLNITLNAVNVNEGKNWLVSRTFVNDEVTKARAIERNKKHTVENSMQYN